MISLLQNSTWIAEFQIWTVDSYRSKFFVVASFPKFSRPFIGIFQAAIFNRFRCTWCWDYITSQNSTENEDKSVFKLHREIRISNYPIWWLLAPVADIAARAGSGSRNLGYTTLNLPILVWTTAESLRTTNKEWIEKWIESPRHFERLVLGCIEADFCK